MAGSQQNGVSHISGYCLLGKMSDDLPANDKITARQDNEFMKCRSFHCSKLDDRHLYIFLERVIYISNEKNILHIK